MLASLFLQTCLLSFAAAAPEYKIQADAWQYGTGGGIVGFIVFILDLIAIFEVINSTRPLSHKLLWSLLIFLFPVIGIVVYYIFSDREKHKQGAGYEAITS